MPKTIRESPVSIRFNATERMALRLRAGTQPLSAYVKQVLFADGGTSLRRLPAGAAANPVLLARILAQLGGSGLAPSLAGLAQAADSGSLHLDDLTVRRLHDACDDLRGMHLLLLQALGKKPPNAALRAERLAVTFVQAATNAETLL